MRQRLPELETSGCINASINSCRALGSHVLLRSQLGSATIVGHPLRNALFALWLMVPSPV